jgi:hypothetical protein
VHRNSVYAVAADGAGNAQDEPTVLSFRTLVDTSAPRIIRKEVLSLTGSSFQVAAAMDEPGSMYYMIAQPAPSQQPPTVAARVASSAAGVQQRLDGGGQLQTAGDARRGLLQSNMVWNSRHHTIPRL